MKTTILLITALIIGTQATKAQVLYSENFDNLTLGNVGTDFTGATPGKGGWHTKSEAWDVPSQKSNNYFNIVNEPGRGNVLSMSTTSARGQSYLQKRGIDVLWNNRNPNNNILKIEIDVYSGDQFSKGGSTGAFQPMLGSIKPKYDFTDDMNEVIGLFQFDPSNISLYFFGGGLQCVNNSSPIFIFQSWISLIYYIDYDNKKIYKVIPSLNFIHECNLKPGDFNIKALLLKSSNWIGSQATTPVYKYDNIVISAVKSVPLSTQDFLSEKFQVFPNPATDLVNITNHENIAIKQIKIFDTAGKLVKTETYTNQTNMQVNTSILASGSYLFHIETTEGTVIKTIIKK